VIIGKEFVFHAAHKLTDYNGKCENLHGHSYRLSVAVEGSVEDDGMVMDFADISRIVQEKVISRLDHSYLNDLLGDKSSLEKLAEWVWQALDGSLPLKQVRLWETDNNFLIYDGPKKED
jgi:6-pyruvoyltetrahydropterin/6-carboxytetrahydropterin synthase